MRFIETVCTSAIGSYPLNLTQKRDFKVFSIYATEHQHLATHHGLGVAWPCSILPFFFKKKKKKREDSMSFEEESACLISREVNRFSQRRSAFSCLVLKPHFGRSFRIRHQNVLTEKAWEDAVQVRGKFHSCKKSFIPGRTGNISFNLTDVA